MRKSNSRNALRLLIIEKYGTVSSFCEESGIRFSKLSPILSGITDPTLKSIKQIGGALKLEPQDYYKYFFREECLGNETN